MEYGFVIGMSLFSWVYLIQFINNEHLKAYSKFVSVILIYLSAFVLEVTSTQTQGEAITLWATSLFYVTLGFIGLWAGLWLVSKFNGGFKNDQDL